MFLRDLLEVSLSLGTLGDMVEPIAIIAAAADSCHTTGQSIVRTRTPPRKLCPKILP